MGHRGNVQRGAGFASMQGSLRMEGGFSRLIQGLAQQLPSSKFLLGARVDRVAQAASGIALSVNTAEGPFVVRAQRVVLALPPRVIQESIEFLPALPPDVARALRAIPTWMAGQAKVVAAYERPHWRDAQLSGDAMSRIGPLVEIHDASPCVGGPFAVFGFVGVLPEARRGQQDQVLDLSRRQLGRLFGEPMLQPTALVLEDWSLAAFTATPLDQGPAPHHPDYGFPRALEGLWDNDLHFAGTEMARTSGGFLEGALEAAEQAVWRLENRSS